MTEPNFLYDRDAFAELLYREKCCVETLQMIGSMGIEAAQLSEAIPVSSDVMEDWIEGIPAGVEGHEPAIDRLKSTVLFTLRRGILNPLQQGMWYTEPNEQLDGKTPLATLPAQGGVEAVLQASTTFTRPEPLS